jgi:5-methyltetrahydrofolate--homocysteine methyltransferase
MDPKSRDSFIEEVRMEYEELRKDYMANQAGREFRSLADARVNKLKTDWDKVVISKPKQLGVFVEESMDLEILLPYIDWTPFFYV